MPITSGADRYQRTNAMAQPAPAPPNPWQMQPQPTATAGQQLRVSGVNWGSTPYGTQTNPMVAPLPGDPVGQPGYTPPAPQQGNAMAPPAAAPAVNNANSLRVNPNYLPEQWDYKQSPEYQQRLAWAQRDLNRQLLSMGRSDSTGGINAMARQQGEIAGQEIDKQYQRALAANMENYGRMFNANQANYGRTTAEDQTGWDRAAYLDQTGWNRGAYLGEQDWNRNYQLANMGLSATNTGVNAGNQTGANLAQLLSNNGASQAALALSRGSVNAGMIERLLNSGFGFSEIEQIFGGRAQSVPGATVGGVPEAQQPTIPAPSVAGIGNPGAFGSDQYSGLPGSRLGVRLMPAQFQIPDYEGENRARVQERQNAMLQKSHLATAGLQQQAMGMQNQDMAREMANRAELESLLTSTPPEQRDRVGLEWLKMKDPEKAAKLQATYLDHFFKQSDIDPLGAAAELERKTGEKVSAGARFAEIPTEKGNYIIDKKTGARVMDPLTLEQAKRDIQTSGQIQVAQATAKEQRTTGDLARTEAQSIEEKKRLQEQGFKAGESEKDRAARIKAAGMRATATSPSVDLTPGGLDIAAEQYAKTGTLPPLGMGGSTGLRQKIINRAAELHPGVDLASNKAGFEANKGSLTALQKNRDAVVAFENTALKNLLQFQKTAKPLIDSGSPLINIPLRQASKQLMGKAEVAAFDAARRVAINEIAKVVSNPNLTGQLSDAARREVESFIPEEATLKQINAVVEILKTDMANRHQSLDEQLGEIKAGLAGLNAEAPIKQAQRFSASRR